MCLMKRETSWRDVVAADGLQALLTRLPSSLLSVHPLRRLSSDGAGTVGSPRLSLAKRGEARSTGLARCFLPAVTPASAGEKKKKGKKREYLIAREGGGAGSSFDENCFRPRFDQLFLSDRPLLNSSFNLALPVSFDLKRQINCFEISISSGKSGKFYEREKYIS